MQLHIREINTKKALMFLSFPVKYIQTYSESDRIHSLIYINTSGNLYIKTHIKRHDKISL